MAEAARTHPPLEVLRVFLKLGLSSFGGPIAHIGYLIDKRQPLYFSCRGPNSASLSETCRIFASAHCP